MLDHHAPAEEVFLDDSFENGWGAPVIPDALGINDGDRALPANAQTTHLASTHVDFGTLQAQLLEPLFQEFPRFAPHRGRATTRFLWIRTEKDMMAKPIQPEGLGQRFEVVWHGAV